jgi:AcrR family transcriptional regulator
MARQVRALATREQILIAAADEIRRVGYSEATLAAISASAGVTTGALYFHFDSKQSIARALIEMQHRIVRTAAEEILKRPDESPLTKMMLMCADLGDRLVDDPVVRAGIRLTTDQSTFEKPVQEPYRDWLITFEDLATEAEAQGQTTGEIPPVVLARFIIPAYTGVQLVSETFTERRDLLERIHEMWQILIRAILPSDAQPAALAEADHIFATSRSTAAMQGA